MNSVKHVDGVNDVGVNEDEAFSMEVRDPQYIFFNRVPKCGSTGIKVWYIIEISSSMGFLSGGSTGIKIWYITQCIFFNRVPKCGSTGIKVWYIA